MLNPHVKNLVTPFTHIFLMGSSEGKDILFFSLMGLSMILSPLSENRIFKKFNRDVYLSVVLFLAFLSYLISEIIEIYIRYKFSVSPFTTFVVLSPTPTSTSILHSHIFKASLSPIFQKFVISKNIHIGTSLLHYIPSWLTVYATIVLFLIYFFGLLSLSERKIIQKILIIFGLSTLIIGIIDGGIFATPSLVGLFILFYMKFATTDSPTGKNLIKPTLIILIIIFIGLALDITHSNTKFYEVTALKNNNEKTYSYMPGKYNERWLINHLTKKFEGKYIAFFMSWNFFSYW